MNKLIKKIIGLVLLFLSIWFIFFLGFVDGPGIDYLSIFFGVLFFIASFIVFYKLKR